MVNHNVISTIVSASREVDNFTDKLGSKFYELFQEDDNTTFEISKSIQKVFLNCRSSQEVNAANSMLMGICGYSILDMINLIKSES